MPHELDRLLELYDQVRELRSDLNGVVRAVGRIDRIDSYLDRIHELEQKLARLNERTDGSIERRLGLLEHRTPTGAVERRVSTLSSGLDARFNLIESRLNDLEEHNKHQRKARLEAWKIVMGLVGSSLGGAGGLKVIEAVFDLLM